MKASATHIRISPRKVRMVVDTVRGKSVSQALSILEFTRKKAALPVQKLLKSAVANAVEKDTSASNSWIGRGNCCSKRISRHRGSK